MLGYDGLKTYTKRHGYMQDGPWLHACASVAAAFFSCTFSAPADIVMTRYQAGPLLGRPYASPLECVRTMVAEEGAMVFFRGCAPAPRASPRP